MCKRSKKQKDFLHKSVYESLKQLALDLNLKINIIMWPVRIALSGLLETPGGCTDLLEILGKEESIKRIREGVEKLS